MPSLNNIYIIDQHAANEKYCFENLIKDSQKMSQNKLICNQKLNLSIVQKSLIRENFNLFKKNGFSILEINDEFYLEKVPFFQNINFTIDDCYEIIINLQEEGIINNEKFLLNKVKTALAYKACRTAVKVGNHLNKNKMEIIVKNLTYLESPWNCPHGRPTMIKTKDLNQIINKFQNNYHRKKISFKTNLNKKFN